MLSIDSGPAKPLRSMRFSFRRPRDANEIAGGTPFGNDGRVAFTRRKRTRGGLGQTPSPEFIGGCAPALDGGNQSRHPEIRGGNRRMIIGCGSSRIQNGRALPRVIKRKRPAATGKSRASRWISRTCGPYIRLVGASTTLRSASVDRATFRSPPSYSGGAHDRCAEAAPVGQVLLG